MFLPEKNYLRLIRGYTSDIYKAYKISKKVYSSNKIFEINLLKFILKSTEYLTDYDEKIIISSILFNPYEFDISLKDKNYFPKDIRKICKDYYFFNFFGLILEKKISAEKLKELIIKSFFKIEAVLIVFAQSLAILDFYNKIKDDSFKLYFLEIIEFGLIPLSHELGLYNLKDLLLNKFISIKDKKGFNDCRKYLYTNFPIDNLKPLKDLIINYLKKQNLKPLRYAYRYKSVGSFYDKVYLSRKIPLEKVYDIYAIRLIYETKKDCYNVLNHLKSNFKMFSNSQISDFIKNPKENGYQSLHIRVDLNGFPFEIQIRTVEMNNNAEFGVAAHFHYKEVSSTIDSRDKKLINFLKSKNLIKKKDKNYKDYITVFTPSKETYDIPKKSTLLDFAFIMHSDFAKYFSYAIVDSKKINNKNYLLKNYQTIKFYKSRNITLEKNDVNNLFLDKNIKELKKII